MHSQRQLSIILLSYNDSRILGAIDSIRRFDNIETTIIVVIDGGSKPELVSRIKNRLHPWDTLVSEADDGIFDALNKGLALCSSDFVGWLGSDDIFTSEISSSDVVTALKTHDLFIGSTILAQGNRVIRVTHCWPSGKGLVKWGLHNPHFSTFGSLELFRSSSFDPKHSASDIVYFLDIFALKPKIQTDERIFTIMQAGGFSNHRPARMLASHFRLFSAYRNKSNFIIASLGMVIKFVYKVTNLVYFRLNKKILMDPILKELQSKSEFK